MVAAQQLDVKRLRPTQWLNGALIDFFGEVFALALSKLNTATDFLLLSTGFFPLLLDDEGRLEGLFTK